jgi:NAD(P)H-flavin reductase/ferredoxin
LAALPTREATAADAAWLEDAMARSAASMGRHVDVQGLPSVLFGRLDHPRFQDVAERCLACGACTSVCPTCFCSSTEEHSSLDGASAEHRRVWDSCFTEGHSTLASGTIRPSTEQRYRQWITHKLGAWVSQFGTSGCVGCGRCIAWCPAGIDLTEELAALREGEGLASLPAMGELGPPTDDDLVPQPAEVVEVVRESEDVVTLRILPSQPIAHEHGQFCQLSLPGIGEAPISISGSDGLVLEHTLRGVGALTRALAALRPGDTLGLRGPYGRGWPLALAPLGGARSPLEEGPIVIVAGGIGLAPLRGLIRALLDRAGERTDVRLFYGARTPADAIYAHELLGWLEVPGFALHLTVDRAPSAWRGHVGVVTRLLDRSHVPAQATALLCGPEPMMRFSVDALLEAGLAPERIFLALERPMRCATGTCGRCQLGPWLVCRDGPVFRYDDLSPLFGRDGF